MSTIDISLAPTVTDEASAESFIRWCCRVMALGFHPDTPFRNYVETNNLPIFTKEESAVLDERMDSVFVYLPNPYVVALNELRQMGLQGDTQ